jgi:hypothetical protein
MLLVPQTTTSAAPESGCWASTARRPEQVYRWLSVLSLWQKCGVTRLEAGPACATLQHSVVSYKNVRPIP